MFNLFFLKIWINVCVTFKVGIFFLVKFLECNIKHVSVWFWKNRNSFFVDMFCYDDCYDDNMIGKKKNVKPFIFYDLIFLWRIMYKHFFFVHLQCEMDFEK